MPVYNGEEYLKQSIESCLNQTYTNFELIIVNDNSSDNSLNIAKHYKKIDTRVSIISNEKNIKLPASLNVGHKAANGEYISWTSDDNIYNLNAIEELVYAIENNDSDLVYSDISIINTKGEQTKTVSYVNFENVIFGNFIGSCFLYKKEVFEKNKGYDETLFLVEDYDFWLRASLHSKFYQLKKNLYNYRLHVDSLTNSISFDDNRNKLYRDNVRKMFSSFVKTILGEEVSVMVDFQTNILTHQKIEFSWLKKNKEVFFRFIKSINNYPNYRNNKTLKKVFLDKMTYVLVLNSKRKYNIQRSMFIVMHFYNVLDFNTVKTLIKYSFFKK